MAAIKKILSPTDFSDTANTAVVQAQALAQQAGCELVLMHVLMEPAFGLAEGSAYAPPLLADEYQRAMREKLEKLAGELGAAHGTRVSTKVAHGTAHEAIVRAADEEGADLIVMGTHGRTGLSHFFLGSVAERVVRTSKVPVLTVRVP